MATGSLYGSVSESTGLYGIGAASGGTYFEWFIFYDSATAPATPTGGSWSFTTNTGTAPSGWLNAPPASPTNLVWVSIAVVDSRSTSTLTWSTPGLMTGAGLPVLTGSGVPSSGAGLNGQLYINTATTPQSMYNKQSGSWVQITGSTLYATSGANTNITSLTGITGGISSATYVQLNTAGDGAVAAGKAQWDPTFGGPSIGMAGGNVNQIIGQDQFVYVHNNTGSTINKGEVVYISGSQGQRVTVALAQANADATSISVLGFAAEAISNNSSGFIASVGLVPNINTSGFADGATLWLSPSVAGGYTTTKPVAPNHLVLLGYVVKGGSVGGGSIYVFTQNGYELDELHDVLITSVANGNYLRYNSAIPAWVNVAGPTGTLVGTTDTQTLTNKTISGLNNTLSNIANSSLSNSSITINGSAISLGGSATIASATPNNLVFGSGLSANANFNGSQQVNLTLASVGTAGTYGDSGTIPVFTTNAFGQISGVSLQSVVVDSSDISGTIAIAQGGTGASSVTNARINLLPSYTGNAGKLLALNSTATDLEWKAVSGVGTVTSVDVSGGTTGLTTFGGPITAAGTITLGGTLGVANGGTGVTSSTGTGNVVLSNSPTLVTPALGTPSSGVVTNLTGTASININGTVGATTASTGAFTTLSASSTVTLSGGTANGVAYLNGSKVVTSGSALVFDGTNLGLGTSSPVSISGYGLITTNGNSGSAVYFQQLGVTKGRLITTANELTLDTANTNPIVFGVNSTEQMRLTSTGLGIGTSSPASKLHVGGSTGQVTTPTAIQMDNTYGTATFDALKFYLFKGASESYGFGLGALAEVQYWAGSSSTGTHVWYTSQTERMRLNASGNLGLGVTPSAWFANSKVFQFGTGGSLESRDNNPLAAFASNSYIDTSGNYKYITTNYATRYLQSNGTHVWSTAPSGTAGNAITFTQAMTLDASGNLALGVTSVTSGYRLHVAGDLRVANSGSETGALQISQASSQGLIQTRYPQPLVFGTNATERMRIDSSGNLGLGVTPSAWATFKGMQIGPNAAAAFIASNGADSWFGDSAYYNAGWKYAYSGVSVSALQQSGGAFKFYTAPSGTAGNAITFTQAMTLDASGYLLIGTTSNPASAQMMLTKAGGTQGFEFLPGSSSTVNTVLHYNRSASAYLTSTVNALDHTWQTSGTERARIDSSGNLLVGKTATSFQTLGAEMRATGQVLSAMSGSTNATETLNVYSTGASVQRFYVGLGGTIYATSTSISAISDATLKENVRDLETGLNEVMALKPRRFDWKNGDAQNVAGFVAQEVEQVLPELVTDYRYKTDDEGNDIIKKSLKMGDILPTLVNAIQEQQAIINSLKARLDAANL